MRMRDIIDIVNTESRWNRAVREGLAADADLPMDPKARLARAQGMGFDTDHVYYHGTSADIARFQKKFHGSTMGAHNREPFAVWLTSAPSVAEVYASYDPSEANWWGKPEDAPKPRQIKPNLMPLYVRLRNPLVIDASRLTHYALLRRKGTDLRDAIHYKHDGLIFRDAEDGTDTRSDIVAVFNPANVRSVFARFDPAKARTTELMD